MLCVGKSCPSLGYKKEITNSHASLDLRVTMLLCDLICKFYTLILINVHFTTVMNMENQSLYFIK